MKRASLDFFGATPVKKGPSTSNSLEVMRFPPPSQPRSTADAIPSTSTAIPSTSTAPSQLVAEKRPNSFEKYFFEKTYFFTGTVERVIKWNKMFSNSYCLFEVIAAAISVQNKPEAQQQIILLKDRNGPVLQVVHYLNQEIQLESIEVGQMLRVVGYMTGPNILTAVTIRLAKTEEVATLNRHCHIGDFSVSRLAKEANSS